MGIHPEDNNLFKKFFKQMAVARSIFTLDGVVQLFWAAFDMPMTVVPLKVALGLGKFDFSPFKKNNHANAQKSIFCTLMQLLMVPLSQAYQKLPKTIELPHLK